MKKISIYRMFWLIGLYSIFANLAHPITPTFIQDLGLHDYMFGVAFAAMATANFVFSPFWGNLSKNIGSAKIIGLGFIGYGVGQAIFGLSTSEIGIVIGRMFAGVFIAAIMVNQMIYIINNSPIKDRGRNLAISATILSVIAPMGYLIGGFLGDYSIPLTFILQVAGLVFVGILNWLILDDPKIDGKLDWQQVVKDSNPIRVVFNARGSITTVLISFLVVATLTSFASTGYEQCFNYFIKDQYGFPPSYNGLLKALVGFIVLISNLSIGLWLIKKTDVNKTLIYVLIVCLFMMIGIIIIDDIVPFIIINVVFFGFNAIYLPMMQTILAKFTETDGGVVVGLFNSVRSFGMIGGSLFAGFIYTVGPKLSFVSSAVALFISVLFATIFYKQFKSSKIEV